nr:unnamed protein product [Callosobruchus analis]
MLKDHSEGSEYEYASLLIDLYDRELVGIIGWAKQIPGFTDLSLNDQFEENSFCSQKWSHSEALQPFQGGFVDMDHQKLSLWRGVSANNSPVIRIKASLALQTKHDIILGLRPSGARPTGVLNQVQQLLLCLPSLRQANYVVRRFWSDVHQQDLVPMNKLFLEMLEAYSRRGL